MRTALKSWRDLPRAPGNPGVVWWDRWLVAVAALSAVVETILRPDMPWRPVALAMGMLVAAALWWRRTHPLGAVVAVFGPVAAFNILTLIDEDWTWELFTAAVVLVLPYTLLRWGSGREHMAGLTLIGVVYVLTIPQAIDLGEAIGGGIVLALPAIVGAEVRAVATRRGHQLEQARLLERGQLARELHDTVAHHVSAIAVQAQAGKELARTNTTAALETLSVIEAEASRTLREMRSMVGALRGGEEPQLTPTRGVADLVQLAENAGTNPLVAVELIGHFDDLPLAVDSAVYRLAQESITNAVRHARSATKVSVQVAEQGSTVRLVVEDDGEPSLPPTDTGYGLIGMQERVKLLGGRLSAGPVPGRGWRVTAVLPLDGLER